MSIMRVMNNYRVLVALSSADLQTYFMKVKLDKPAVFRTRWLRKRIEVNPAPIWGEARIPRNTDNIEVLLYDPNNTRRFSLCFAPELSVPSVWQGIEALPEGLPDYEEGVLRLLPRLEGFFDSHDKGGESPKVVNPYFLASADGRIWVNKGAEDPEEAREEVEEYVDFARNPENYKVLRKLLQKRK